jgi:hypothetical protein
MSIPEITRSLNAFFVTRIIVWKLIRSTKMLPDINMLARPAIVAILPGAEEDDDEYLADIIHPPDQPENRNPSSSFKVGMQ